jgi:outer membrane protein
MKKIKRLAACSLLLLLAIGCEHKSNERFAYVLTQKVFKEFEGTKELEKKVSKLQEKQKYILDSLTVEIKSLEAAGGSPEKLNAKKEVYNKVLSEFGRSNQEQDQQYTEALWKQINQYISEYGKEKGYAFIYGADGTGSIMYADSTLNVTEPLVKYMNGKYAGK